MYSVGRAAPPVLFVPLLMHLILLFGGSSSAPLVFNVTNSTEGADAIVYSLVKETLVNVPYPLESNQDDDAASSQSPSTLESFVHSSSQFIMAQIDYLKGLFLGSANHDVLPFSTLPSRGRGLAKIDLV